MTHLIVWSHEPEMGDWYPCLEIVPELRVIARLEAVAGREAARSPDDVLVAGDVLMHTIDDLVEQNGVKPQFREFGIFAARHSLV